MRVMSTTVVLAMVAAIAAWTLAAPRTAPAADAATLQGYQTLYLTERFTAAGPSVAHDASVLPESMVALKGEREGFQVAVNNQSGGALTLGGDVAGDGALSAALASGQIGFELLRVGFVNVPQLSKNMPGSPGMFPDPLPPLRNDSSAGRLSIPAGSWGGVALIMKVRTDAAAGVYGGNLELFEGPSAGNGTVHVRVPFTLAVGNTTLLQTGEPKSFKTVMNVEGEAYWLQHADMRNKLPGTTLYGDRMAQVTGLLSFLDSRNISPLEYPFGNPAPTGSYSCAYASPHLSSMRYLDQLANRYMNRTRDINPAAQQFPVRMVATHTNGCNPDSATGGFEGTIDKYRTPGVKQDDVFDSSRAPAYYSKVASQWNSSGLYKPGATYAKSPFDEPGEASDRQKTTMITEVPKANVAMHRAFGGKAKVVLAAWPRNSTPKRLCRKTATGPRCTTVSGDAFDNRILWNGGADDVDVWMPHFSRLFGRTTPPILKPYNVNREREYADRLKSIRAKGKETWAYNFYTATNTMPQVTIDAPGTDPRLQYLLLARDGHTGLFISNLMMGWGTSIQTHPGSSLRRKGDPYDQALYFKHPLYGFAAGWGTFIYPGYVPSLGLTGETARNSESAMPVSSLRMEAFRDGTEDANLIQTYRNRFGDAAVQAKLKVIFPGTSVLYPSTLGNVVGPKYDNGNNLAMRMESVRRQMIAELG
jgi:hypothetical protein